jgi:type IV pilus assembly protein PilZ
VQEKREYPRSPVNLHVSCDFDTGESCDGVARDMSLGGMFIEAAAAPAFGSKLSLQCQLPGMKEESRLPAVVRWVTTAGFGVQFGLLGARETHAITSLLRSRR